MSENLEKILHLLLDAAETVKKEINSKRASELSMVSLIQSDSWPQAVDPNQICSDSEEDKMERAEGLLDFIERVNLERKKFLDFGCGEGHAVLKASEFTSAIGYDIVKAGNLSWEDGLLTTNFANIQEQAPFDVVLLYDVLDHTSNPVEELKRIKSIIHDKSKIFIRCHSWMSRHGSHIYKELNKAWAHLFLTEEELTELNVTLPFIQKYYFPMKTQQKWFADSGLNIISSKTKKSIVEPFFKKQILLYEVQKHFGNTFPEAQMSQEFNDYVLGWS